jgi:hypothetical protein
MNPPAPGVFRMAVQRELERHVAIAWLSAGSCATLADRDAIARVTVLEPVNSKTGGNGVESRCVAPKILEWRGTSTALPPA